MRQPIRGVPPYRFLFPEGNKIFRLYFPNNEPNLRLAVKVRFTVCPLPNQDAATAPFPSPWSKAIPFLPRTFFHRTASAQGQGLFGVKLFGRASSSATSPESWSSSWSIRSQ